MTIKYYICKNCGFEIRDTEGVYYCPHCATQLKVENSKGFLKDSFKRGKFLIYFLEIVFLLPCFFILGGIYGIFLFILFFIFTRMILIRISRNYSKKAHHNILFNSQKYVCLSCGHSFRGKEVKCPICEANLRYDGKKD